MAATPKHNPSAGPSTPRKARRSPRTSPRLEKRHLQASSRPTRSQPHWDTLRRELRVGTQLAKRFQQPAPCQEQVLAAFQEQNWPERMDDPLPHATGINPKDRLHDTVKNLNRFQANSFIHFFCCNNGRGVGWMLL